MVFEIKLRGQQLIVPSNIVLAAGARNSVSVRIDADEAWDGLTMTLTCRTVYLVGIETHTVAALTPQTGVVIPHENMIPGALYLGVTGYGADGAVKLTTAQMVVPIKINPSEDDTADPSTEITPALGAQILAYIGLLDSLTTDKKNTIVAAINELAAKLSGIVGTFHSALQAYPSTGYTGLPVFESKSNGAIISNLAIIRAADEEGTLEVPTKQLVNSMISGVLSYTMKSFEVALAAYRDGDTAGLPVMDPDSDTGFSNMILQSSHGEGAGSPYLVPTLGSVELMLRNALALGYVDVTKDYEAAQGSTDIGENPRAFLWSLPPGRYFLCEDGEWDKRYYLQALAGERPDYIGGRILYTVYDFCNIEFYGGNNGHDHNAIPDLEIIGETGEIYRRGKLLGSGSGGDGGKSAYELAVEQGFEGSLTAWLASLVGRPGDPGTPGKDGRTPVKGIDYFTPEEQEQCRQWIAAELAKRGQLRPEFVNSVDKCTDPTKLYVLPDGFIYAYLPYSNINPGGEPLFVNRANPQSSDWHADKRFSSTSSDIKDCVGSVVSNVISAKNGDIIRIKGLRNGTTAVTSNSYVSIAIYSDEAGTAKIMNPTICFDKTKAQHSYGVKDIVEVVDGVIKYNAYEFVANNGNTEQFMPASPIVSFRVCGEPVTTVEDVIVTVNEGIRYSEASTEQGYGWQSTGRAFVAADYEDRIIANEQKTASNTERIAELEAKVKNGLSEDLTDAEKLNLIKLWDKPVYDASPVTLIADDRAKPALTTADRTIAAIYAKYRELMARFPQYITETNMGNSASSDIFEPVPILRFDFREPDGRTNGGYTLYEKKPKLIFMSGVHTEWVGVWGLYYALEEIMTNPDFDDVRRNAHIIVVPCSNPFCLNGWTSSNGVDGWRMSHVNANGVAIHNNFHVDHSTSGNVGEYNYGGPSPCSEPETQYIDQIMAENPDAVAFVSCHNNDYCTEFGTSVIWASSATAHMCNITFRLVDKLSKAWLNKYGQALIDAINTYKTDALPEGDYRLGRAQLSTSKGTEAKNALKYGIQGVNVEISRMMKVFSGPVDGTSEVMTHGAEVYANLMRTLLANYDHKDKLMYFGTI